MNTNKKAVIYKKPTNAKYKRCKYCGCERHRHTYQAGCLGPPGVGIICGCTTFVGDE